MKADKTFIFKMAGEAQKASEFLHGLQPAIEAPSPALADVPGALLALPEPPSLPVATIEPPAPPLALVVDRPEKQHSFVETERKRRAVKKVIGQTELF